MSPKARNQTTQARQNKYKATRLKVWNLDVDQNPLMNAFHRSLAEIALNVLGRLCALASAFPQNGQWAINEILQRHTPGGVISIVTCPREAPR
ncbi:MAG: hypothetical protein MMC33_007836 [Icmadophila ericetorum]|nr:hypothetical protein [Icmadophila ericetorum]